MAAPVSEKISVIVVDGVIENLHRLGFPLSAFVSMQAVGAQLSEASWNVGQTASGLSVSLFWPGNGVVAANNSSNRVSRSKR